ncbi:MAG: 4-(cytidine 5'-diphospho)-2-C-methyl-D-erythritol kinase [Dehalococcoidia bacterium]
MYIKSYAKINFTLEVLNKYSNGFHEIKSLMHTIDLHDEISIENSKTLNIESNTNTINVMENIMYKTILLVKNEFSIKKWVDINIKKNIPISSGLGGGSSNAASTLLCLNKLWNLNMDYKKLANLASLLGSDVPFFIKGGGALVSGRGEIINPINDFNFNEILLIYPKDIFNFTQTKTKYMFSKILDSYYTDGSYSNKIVNNINQMSLFNSEDFYNPFLSILSKESSEFSSILTYIKKQNIKKYFLSGAGPTIGIFDFEGKIDIDYIKNKYNLEIYKVNNNLL